MTPVGPQTETCCATTTEQGVEASGPFAREFAGSTYCSSLSRPSWDQSAPSAAASR